MLGGVLCTQRGEEKMHPGFLCEETSGGDTTWKT